MSYFATNSPLLLYTAIPVTPPWSLLLERAWISIRPGIA